MNGDTNEELQTGFIEGECKNNNKTNMNDKPQKDSDCSITIDNQPFYNEDLMTNDINSSVKTKVSYFGIVSDTKFSAIISISASAIGGGCLNFPSILEHIGLPLVIGIFIFVSLNIYFTIDLLRRFVVDTKYFSFALMTSEILGDKWLKVYTFSSLIFYLSIEINYLSEIYTIISNLVDFSNNVILMIIYFILTIIIEIIICSYISNIRNVHLLSLISSLIFIIVLISIISQGIIHMIHDPGNKFDYNILINPKINNHIEFFFGLMTYIIKYVYGFSYHSTYPTLISNLKEVDENNTKNTHIISFIYIACSYFLITFFGFFLKIPMADVLSINDLSSKDNIQILFFKIILCLFLFTVVPLRFIIIRDNYSSLIDKEKKLSFKKDLFIVFICILFCNIIVFLTNENLIHVNIISNFMSIFAGIFGVIISFVLPVINYIGVNGKRKMKSIIGYILIAIFSIIGAFSVGYSIYGIVIRNKYDNE